MRPTILLLTWLLTTGEPHPPAPRTVQAQVAEAWPGDDRWAHNTVHCETGGTWDPAIVSRSGKYHGLWQMDAAFWAGYKNDEWPDRASQASPTEQTIAAWRAYSGWDGGQKARGWRPWPTCGNPNGRHQRG